ncbi:MAG: protein BatD, partial [Gammaproteobacteria bacterium]|nr:protein BatD [Gammaproteobacteria bacterium]
MRRVLAWSMLALALVGGTAGAAVRAWLDTNHVGAGDTVQLTLQRDGQTSSQPDLEPLKQDFDVISVGSSSNVQIVNGTVSSQTQAQIVLSPKRAGQLTVPAITWGGETSAPLALNVGAATPGAAGVAGAGGSTGPAAGSPVFVETQVATKSPYVQAAVDVTVRIYTTEQLYQASLEFPPDSDVLVQQVGGDSHGTVVKNGQQYDLVERHYVLFPQRSGALHIPGAVLAGQVPVRIRQDQFSDDPFANFFGAGGMSAGTKPIRVQGDAIDLDVRPRPAESGSGPWLPAQGLSVSGAWHPMPLSVHAGDPVTVDLHIQAEGLTAAQLPDLSASLALPPGLKAYPDQAKLHNAAQGDLVTGSRDQSVALIADRPGHYVVPAVHLAWWDTKADQQRFADLPAQTLEVLAAPVSATAANPPPAAGAAAAAPAPALAAPPPT